MLDFNDVRKFMLEYKQYSDQDLIKLYNDHSFWKQLFSVPESRHQILMFVLLNVSKSNVKYFTIKDIADSIFSSDPIYKIKYLFRYFAGSSLIEQLYENEKFQSYTLKNCSLLKKKFGNEFLLNLIEYYSKIGEFDFVGSYLLYVDEEDRNRWIEDSSHFLMMKKAMITSDLSLLFFFPTKSLQFSGLDPFIEALAKRNSNFILQFLGKPYQFSEDVFRNPIIQEKITSYQDSDSKKSNPYMFRYLMNSLYDQNIDSNLLLHLEVLRKEKMKQLMEHCNICLKDLKEIICDYFFEDYDSNILEQIQTILHFSLEDEKWFQKIGKANIQKFTEFLNIMNCNDCNLLLNYFYNHIEDNYVDLMYHCLFIARDTATKELVNSLSNIEQMKQNQNLKKRFVNHVLVIELSGEPFSFFIHKSRNKNMKEVIPYEKMTSLSYISDKNPFSTYDLDGSCIYGFSNIEAENIVHLCSSDSFSLINNEQPDKIIFMKSPEYVKVDTLVKKTNQDYNEIVILNKDPVTDKKNLVPDFLITYDEIDFELLKIAEQNQIPIVKINKEFYFQEQRHSSK